jgi:hypothetical protein
MNRKMILSRYELAQLVSVVGSGALFKTIYLFNVSKADPPNLAVKEI